MQIVSGIMPKATKAVLYGPEGIGKSTFASMAPNPLYIDTEGSTTRLNVRRIQPAPESWTMILEQVRYVLSNPSVCGTLILDTADWAQKHCIDAVCAQRKMSSIEDTGYGKGYVFVYEEFGRLLNLLDQVIDRGVNVIITAHAAMRKFDQPDEMGSYDRWELKLINSKNSSIAGMVKEWADMVLFANYETIVVKNDQKKGKAQGGQRVMYTTHHPCWDAKNRFGLPEELPFEFSKITHIFRGVETLPAAPQEAPQNTPESLAPATPPEPPSSPAEAAETPPVSAEQLNLLSQVESLMKIDGIGYGELTKVVEAKGIVPAETPLKNYNVQTLQRIIKGWAAIRNNVNIMRGTNNDRIQ